LTWLIISSGKVISEERDSQMSSVVQFDSLAVANELRPVLVRLGRELRRETEQLGITSRQATLLWLVNETPETTAAELAEQEGVSAPAMTRQVDRLEQAGLLLRVPSTEDRRKVGLVVSTSGKRLLRRIRARRTTWLAQRLGQLDAAELDALERALPVLRRLTESG
jgi:DNA-binding MarR family transcriptional regulator